MKRAWLLALAACGSHGDGRPKADGAWHRFAGPAQIHAGGGLPGGGFWLAGHQRGPWILRVAPDGSRHEMRLDAGTVLDGAATPDGDLWITIVGARGADHALWMGRIGVDGAMRAETTVPYDVSGQTYDLAVVTGGAVAIGFHNPVTSGLTHGWVVCVDDDGTQRYAARVGASGYGFLSAVAALDDGGVATVGRIDGDASLVLADARGHTSVQAPVLADGLVRANEVIELDGGDLLLLGIALEPGTVVAERRGRDGTVRWRRDDETRADSMGGVLRVGDDVLALAALAQQLVLIRVSADGTVTTRELDGPAILGPVVTTAFLLLDAAGAPALLQIELDGHPRWRLVAL